MSPRSPALAANRLLVVARDRRSGRGWYLTSFLLVGVASGTGGLAVSAGAQEEAPRFSLRGSAVWISPAGEVVAVASSQPGETATHDVTEDGSGFALGLEYRWRPRLGIELGVLIAEMDTTLHVAGAGSTLVGVETLGLESVALGVNWHLAPARRLDAAIGLFVAQTTFDDVIFLSEVGRSDKHTFDDDHGFGVKAALDVPFRRGGRWAVGLELRYLITILESEVAGQDLDLDPLQAALGVVYRF